MTEAEEETLSGQVSAPLIPSSSLGRLSQGPPAPAVTCFGSVIYSGVNGEHREASCTYGTPKEGDFLLRTPSCAGFTLEGPLGASRATVIDSPCSGSQGSDTRFPILPLYLPKPYSSRRCSNERLPTAGTHPTLLKSLCSRLTVPSPPSPLTYQFLFFTVTSTHHPPHCPQSPQTSSISVTRDLLKTQFSSPT